MQARGPSAHGRGRSCPLFFFLQPLFVLFRVFFSCVGVWTWVMKKHQLAILAGVVVSAGVVALPQLMALLLSPEERKEVSS